MRDSELKRTSVYLDVEMMEILSERPDANQSEACRRGMALEAYGAEYVAADIQNGLTDDHLHTVQSARAMYRQLIEQHSVNGMIRVEDALAAEADSFIPAIHALARERHEREMDVMDEYEQEQVEQFESALEAVEEELQDGARVFPSHGKIERLAKLRGKTPEDIIALLKERNPDLPDKQFRQKDIPKWRHR